MSLKHGTALITVFILGVTPAIADTALLPGNAGKGKTLHATNCAACHDAKIYTRKDRRVQTLSGLIGQVEACNTLLKKELSRGQVNDLIAYLNESYYRFE
jgi:cytochrome c2